MHCCCYTETNSTGNPPIFRAKTDQARAVKGSPYQRLWAGTHPQGLDQQRLRLLVVHHIGTDHNVVGGAQGAGQGVPPVQNLHDIVDLREDGDSCYDAQQICTGAFTTT